VSIEQASAEIASDETESGKEPFLWKTAILYVLLVVGMFVTPVLLFAFVILFIYWGFVSIMLRETNLVEPVKRETHPVMYWLLVGLWFFYAAWCTYGCIVETYKMITGQQ
jgi:hypothetical protein